MPELRGKVRDRPGRSPVRADYRSWNYVRLMRSPVAGSRRSAPSKIFPSRASKTPRWQSL